MATTNTKKTTDTTSTDTASTKTASYTAQTDAVNDVYDKAQESSLAALKTSFDESMSTLEQSKAEIPETYNEAANTSAANYERQKAAFDATAAANGINTGAGSQVALSMLNTQNASQSSINKAKADAVNDIDTQIANLKTSYSNSVAQAIADNDYERAAANLTEYRDAAKSAVTAAQSDFELLQEQAETKAQYGDFSGYSDLGYSDEDIALMKKKWEYDNPTLAKQLYGTGSTTGSGGGGGKLTVDEAIASLSESVANGASMQDVASVMKGSQFSHFTNDQLLQIANGVYGK